MPVSEQQEVAREAAEAQAAQYRRDMQDAISAAVGSPIYVARHYFEGLRDAGGRRLVVSRYYFSEKVVVDIGAKDPEPKRRFCDAHGIRYVLIEDAFDAEAVREQLAPRESVSPIAVKAQRRQAPRSGVVGPPSKRAPRKR